MLKIAEGINLDELKKYGFKESYIMSDWCYQKKLTDCEYEEYIIMWCYTKEVQVHAIELLDTLYDLIQAGIVVKE